MRRFLYVPLVQNLSLDNNEGFQEFFSFSRRLMESGEKAFWYVLLPSWVTDGMRSHERVQYVYLDTTRDVWVLENLGYPAYELAQNFSRRGGRYTVDAVMTNCTKFASYLSVILSDPVKKKIIPVFTRDVSDGLRIEGGESVKDWFRLISDKISCYQLLRSGTEKQMYAEMISRRLHPAISREFDGVSTVWPVGLDLRDIDRVVGEAKDSKENAEELTLFCGGDFRNRTAKARELRIAKRIFSAGGPRTSIVSTSYRAKIEQALPKKDTSFLKGLIANVNIDTYRHSVASAHVFVSVLEDRDVSMFSEELTRLILGQIGVFPYTQSVIRELGDYPFVYNEGEEDEAVEMAIWVLENYDKATEMAKPMISKLREKHDIRKTSVAAWDAIQKRVDRAYVVNQMKESRTGRPTLFQTVYKVASGLGKEFTLDVFLDVMEEHLNWLKAYGRKGSLKEFGDVPKALPTLYDMRMMLDNLGWVDTSETAKVVLRKIRDPLPEIDLEAAYGKSKKEQTA